MLKTSLTSSSFISIEDMGYDKNLYLIVKFGRYGCRRCMFEQLGVVQTSSVNMN